MLRKLKHIFLKGFKIALGTVAAIVIAEFLQLQFPTSAGTVALLTLLTTKKGTVKLIVQRILSFFMTVLLCMTLFRMLPDMIAFTAIMIVVATVLVALKCEATLSINALIAIHFLTEQNFTREFIVNEFLLVLIGVLIAFLLNLIHHYTAYEDQLDEAIDQVDKKIQELLMDIVKYIRHPDSHSASWGELGRLEKIIQNHMKYAIEYDENVFGSHSQYYIDYFEVREFQCELLHMLHYEIRKIRHMPAHAEELANFIEYLIPHIHETNDPSPQLQVLNELLLQMKKKQLPQTHDEFESYAILYHILMDMEDFLIRKKQFVDKLDSVQKILHWKHKRPSS